MKKYFLMLFLIPKLSFSENCGEDSYTQVMNDYVEEYYLDYIISDIYLNIEMADMSLEDRIRINKSINTLEKYLFNNNFKSKS